MARAAKIPRSLRMELGIKRTNTEFLKESSREYHRVLAQFKPEYRIIECSHGKQWILQKQEASHAAPWRALGYAATKSGLINLCGRLKLLPMQNIEKIVAGIPQLSSKTNRK